MDNISVDGRQGGEGHPRVSRINTTAEMAATVAIFFSDGPIHI